VPNEEIQDLSDDVAIHFALQAATPVSIAGQH
jgi:hypothetical protein